MHVHPKTQRHKCWPHQAHGTNKPIYRWLFSMDNSIINKFIRRAHFGSFREQQRQKNVIIFGIYCSPDSTMTIMHLMCIKAHAYIMNALPHSVHSYCANAHQWRVMVDIVMPSHIRGWLLRFIVDILFEAFVFVFILVLVVHVGAHKILSANQCALKSNFIWNSMCRIVCQHFMDIVPIIDWSINKTNRPFRVPKLSEMFDWLNHWPKTNQFGCKSNEEKEQQQQWEQQQWRQQRQ